MALTKKRREQVLDYRQERLECPDPEIEADLKKHDAWLRKRLRDTIRFASTLTAPEEIQLFAANWNWDGEIRPLLEIIKNPNCDAGTGF